MGQDKVKVAELMPANSRYARALFDAFPEYCHVILNARGGLEDSLVADVLHAVGRQGWLDVVITNLITTLNIFQTCRKYYYE